MKKAQALACPVAVIRHIKALGDHLKIARRVRKESLALFAERMQVSVPTLRRMEAGEPSVSMATYATALWLIGRDHFLAELANPANDEAGLSMQLRNIRGKHHER